MPVDRTGLGLALGVPTADARDRGGWPRRRVSCADGGYTGPFVARVKGLCGRRVQTVRRPEAAVGFVPPAERWVVGRTFGWFTRDRRSAKDFEADMEMGEAMSYAAMTHRMVRRLSKS